MITLIVLAIKFPQPTPFQYTVFRTILSLAAAGAAAMIPGFITANLDVNKTLFLRAGGALAVFVVIFFYNPAALVLQQDKDTGVGGLVVPPATLPNGLRLSQDQQRAFMAVWQALVMLDMAGEDLWANISRSTLSNFADRYRSAQECVGSHALLFSPEDYASLQEVLRAADFYLGGKLQLSEIYAGAALSDRIIDLSPKSPDLARIRDRVQQNKRWLTRYRNVLNNLRSRFHHQMTG